MFTNTNQIRIDKMLNKFKPFYFDGATFNPRLDSTRLSKQVERVYSVLITGEWVTLSELSFYANAPEASVSARIRDLRKKRYGSQVINSRRRSVGLWEYRLVYSEPQQETLL
jgi:hypothetical protein